ncbi:MAG: hypothetical protein LBU86_00730 [Oscillospiraceae bacterium]|jgi:ferric-dicitrate binding protein FerR (iron transport regulator)|nr:hypothetical protein [Oscillospiraceae bacterium]
MSDAIRDGAAIIADLHLLTIRMAEQRHDADFLTDGVEKRQALIDEYQRWAGKHPEARTAFERTAEAKQAVEKILSMDQVITRALTEFKAEAQQNVKNANAQKKVMGYLGGSISASGSYLDMKK